MRTESGGPCHQPQPLMDVQGVSGLGLSTPLAWTIISSPRLSKTLVCVQTPKRRS